MIQGGNHDFFEIDPQQTQLLARYYRARCNYTYLVWNGLALARDFIEIYLG